MDNNVRIQRLKECEVCAKNDAKYTCPRCELRTCSLECVRIHKKELDCNGLRDKVKFKMIKHFQNMDLLSDYRLLEETARVVNRSAKLPSVSCYNQKSGTLPTDLYRLKCTALRRGVQLFFLPPSFKRHQANTSYLDHSTQNLFWRVEWVFPQADNLSYPDDHVLDSALLSACVHKYIEPGDREYPALTFYQAAGHSAVKMLLKAERTAPNRYYLLDPTSTLRENLDGKAIIEYPVIHVILSDHIHMYNVFSEEEENKEKRKRYNNTRSIRKKTNNNFLFSNSNDRDVESNEETSDTENPLNAEDNHDSNNQFRSHHRFPRRGRGRFRGRGRGRNNFRHFRGNNQRNFNTENSGNS